MSKQKSALNNIYYIELPEGFSRDMGEVRIDPSKKLPVEYPPGTNPADQSSLSWEMIISGMLKVLAYEPNHEDADYYRNFVLQAKPDIVSELTETGVLKARNGDFAIAEEIFLALSGLLPGNPLPTLNLALMYEQAADAAAEGSDRAQESEQRAYTCYQEVLTSDEAPPEASFNAGFFFLRRSNHERARQLFERFLSETENNEEDEAERRGEARKIIEEINARNLDDTQFKEAFDFIKLGREDDAIDRINRFLERHPDVWNAWFLLGWARRRKGLYTEGREAFEKVMELGGTNADTLNELAICLMETGDLAESLIRLREALAIEPENTKVMSNIGIVLLKQGDPAEAVPFFHAVLEYDPEDPVAAEYLKTLEDDA